MSTKPKWSDYVIPMVGSSARLCVSRTTIRPHRCDLSSTQGWAVTYENKLSLYEYIICSSRAPHDAALTKLNMLRIQSWSLLVGSCAQVTLKLPLETLVPLHNRLLTWLWWDARMHMQKFDFDKVLFDWLVLSQKFQTCVNNVRLFFGRTLPIQHFFFLSQWTFNV